MQARNIKWDEKEKQAFESEILSQFETQANPYYASARIWDDGIIDPLDTRKVLATGLKAAANTPISKTDYSVFRM